MTKRTLTAHVNCTPWIDDGEWHIVIERDYFTFSAVDDDDSDTFSAIDNLLETALDKGIIHSYYIRRKDDPKPVVHPPHADEGNGDKI